MREITRENAYTINNSKLEDIVLTVFESGFDFVHLDEIVDALYISNADSIIEVRLAPYDNKVDCMVLFSEMGYNLKDQTFDLVYGDSLNTILEELKMINKMDRQGWFNAMHDLMEKTSSDSLRSYKRNQERKLDQVASILEEVAEML